MKVLTQAQYKFLLQRDLATFAGRCFQDLNPQTCLAMNGHLEVIANRGPCDRAERLAFSRAGRIAPWPWCCRSTPARA
jgi:hypothetical protein